MDSILAISARTTGRSYGSPLSLSGSISGHSFSVNLRESHTPALQNHMEVERFKLVLYGDYYQGTVEYQHKIWGKPPEDAGARTMITALRLFFEQLPSVKEWDLLRHMPPIRVKLMYGRHLVTGYMGFTMSRGVLTIGNVSRIVIPLNPVDAWLMKLCSEAGMIAGFIDPLSRKVSMMPYVVSVPDATANLYHRGGSENDHSL